MKKLLFITFSFLAWLFINLFFSKIKFHTEFEIHNFINYFLILWILSTFEHQDIQKILKYIIAGLLLITTISFYQFLILHQQPQGTLINPNILAGYLIMCIPVLIYYMKILPEENKILKYIFFLVLISIFLCLLLTASIGAIFAFMTAFLVVKFRWKSGILISIILFLILVLSGVIDKTSISDRIFWWLSSYNIIKENFLTGTGLGTFEYVYPKYRISKLSSMFAHSSFLQFTTETGIVGILLLIILITLALKKISNKYFKLSLLSILFQNFVDYNLYIFSNGILFCSFIGIANKLNSNTEISKISSNIEKTFKIMTIFLLIFYSISVLKLYFSTVYYNLGKNLIFSDELQIAESYLSKSLRLKKNAWFAYGQLSDIYQKKYKQTNDKNFLYKSIELLEIGIKYNPYCSQYYDKLSQIYAGIGKKDMSILYLKKFYEYGGKSRKYADY